MNRKINKAPPSSIREEVGALLDSDFSSSLVKYIRRNGYRLDGAETTIRLAVEFGFCYGVDRAVEYAFAARHRFPDRQIWVTGEIIHNPRVNSRLREMGIGFLPDTDDLELRYRDLGKKDVILIPAFGAEAGEMAHLLAEGHEIVDTTCGSVLNVWKRVRRYAAEGITSIVHGKFDHEETLATCSQVLAIDENGKYLVIRDLEEAEILAGHIESGDFSGFSTTFSPERHSPEFDANRDLGRIGLANQTTMLESESREIQHRLEKAMKSRWGDEASSRFLAFGTICSATEDRQQAVRDLLASGVDRIIVIGGYNSSNTGHLLEISSEVVPAYHIKSAECLVNPDSIIAKPLGGDPVEMSDWLPTTRQIIGVTGGASTPDSVVGQVIERLCELRGLPLPSARELEGLDEISTKK